MRTVDKENTEAKRTLVLRAAMKCFSKIGLQKASIKDICKISGMRSGHIYYYFKNKDEIVEAAFEASHLIGLESEIEEFRDLANGKDLIGAIIAAHQKAEAMRKEWNLTPSLRLEFLAEMSRNKRLRAIGAEGVKRIQRVQREFAERAAASQLLDPRIGPDMLVHAMTLLWTGLGALRATEDGKIDDYERVARTMMGSLLDKKREELGRKKSGAPQRSR